MDIQGEWEPQFAPVAEAFKHNFQSGLEADASIGIYFRGKPVVDLWGAWRIPNCSGRGSATRSHRSRPRESRLQLSARWCWSSEGSSISTRPWHTGE